MNKPIVDHYGAYVTKPEEDAMVFVHDGKNVTDVEYNIIYETSFLSGDVFVNELSASMDVVRKDAVRRLKVMAYGDGWLPKGIDEGHGICPVRGIIGSDGDYAYNLGNIRFYFYCEADDAMESITTEEIAAFEYTYKSGKE